MEELLLEERIEPLVLDAGLILVDMTLARAGKRLMLRLLVDRRERVSVSECAALARRIKDLLDGEMLLGSDNYRLEVSSPGVGRRLSSDADWERTVGRLLNIQTDAGDFEGRLAGRDGDTLVFDDGEIVALSSIIRAVEVLDDPGAQGT